MARQEAYEGRSYSISHSFFGLPKAENSVMQIELSILPADR